MARRKWADVQLVQAVKKSISYAQVIEKLGLNKNHAGNYGTVKKHIERLQLDVSHFLGQGHLRGKTHGWSWKKRKPLKEILVRDSSYSRGLLKVRILEEGLLKYECAICGLKPIWRGKPLNLILDHANGVNNDNRLKNLRFLCPNCDSQQPTFSRGQRKKEPVYKRCVCCGKEISRNLKQEKCRICLSKGR